MAYASYNTFTRNVYILYKIEKSFNTTNSENGEHFQHNNNYTHPKNAKVTHVHSSQEILEANQKKRTAIKNSLQLTMLQQATDCVSLHL